MDSLFPPGESPPPPPELCWLEEAGSQKFAVRPPRNFCDPASSNRHNSGRVHWKKNVHTITAKGFSNPHTRFQAPQSRRLGINHDTN